MPTTSSTLPTEVLVGQLFISVMRNARNLGEALADHRKNHYGGVFLKRANLRTPDRARALTFRFRRHTKELPPLMVCVDEEGGLVNTMGRLTVPAPSAAALGAAGDPDLTRDVYLGIGEKLRALGINTVFAPVLDVNTEAGNPVIGTRSFGRTAEAAARHGKAAVAGLRESGVVHCVKHFPGHGATTRDSHRELPQVDAGREVLNERELAPFLEVLEGENPPEMVMTAHVAYKALDKGTPATLSSAILQEMLRREIGFQGLVVTDSMDMRAITDREAPGKAALKAIAAGADLLLYGADPAPAAEAYRAVLDAVNAGKLERKRVEESVDRSFRVRDRLRGQAWIDDRQAARMLRVEHDQVFFRAASEGLVLEGNAGVLKEIPGAAPPKLAVLPREIGRRYRLPLNVVREQLAPEGFSMVEVGPRPTAEEIETAVARAAEASVVVVGTASRGKMGEENRRLVDALTRRETIKVGVALLDPGDAEHMMAANCRIKTFGFTVPQLWAMCQKLAGEVA